MTKEAIILIGLPCTGKSTYVKEVLENSADFGVVVISSDNIVEQLAVARGQTYSEAFKDVIGEATKLMEQELSSAMSQGKNILWDQTNLTAKSRESKIKRLQKEGYIIHARIFNVPEDIRSKLQSKRASATGKDIPSHVIESMRKSYQAPTHEEGFENIIHNEFNYNDD